MNKTRRCDFCGKKISPDPTVDRILLSADNELNVDFPACSECLVWAKGILRAEVGNR